MTPEPCDLCGVMPGPGIRLIGNALVEWTKPVGKLRFDTVTRCDDRVACRTRVEAKREPWPVADRTEVPR